MATISYETGLPEENIPEPLMKRQAWECSACAHLQHSIMKIGVVDDLECEECHEFTTVEATKFNLKSPTTTYMHPDDIKRVKHMWRCKECDLEHMHILPERTAQTIECNRCGTSNNLLVHAKEEPVMYKTHANRITCEECGFVHRYMDTAPKRCGGCEADMTRKVPDEMSGYTAATPIRDSRTFSERNGITARPMTGHYRTTCRACGYIHAHGGAKPPRCGRCEELLDSRCATLRIGNEPTSLYRDAGRYRPNGSPIRAGKPKKKKPLRRKKATPGQSTPGYYNPNQRILKETSICQECGNAEHFHPFFDGPEKCRSCGSTNLTTTGVTKKKVSVSKAGKCESIW